MRIVKETKGQFIMIAILMIAIMMVSIVGIMYSAVTYYRHERWEEYLTIIDNLKTGFNRLVEISLANYTQPPYNNAILENNLNQWQNDVKKAYPGLGLVISYSLGGALSGQTLYAHQETTIIGGTPYYLQKVETANSSGLSLSTTVDEGERKLFGKFVYPLTNISSIPASTWTVYYRAWRSSSSSANSTSSPSSIPAGAVWTNPTNGYSSNGLYATTSTDSATQQYGNYSFGIPENVTIDKVEVGFEAYTSQNEKIGISCSWDGGFNWATEQTSDTLPNSDPNTVTWMDFTNATSWTVDKLSSTNFRIRVKSIKQGTMKTVYLDWVPVRVTYSAPISAHVDVDILIRKSGGAVRQIIATGVANSESLTTTLQTLSGTYSWASYTVIDQTDYLEIDYYVQATTADSAITAYLRIDDNTLATVDQTRATNIRFSSSSEEEDGLTLDWYKQESFSEASATISINVTSAGLTGYEFVANTLSRITILDATWTDPALVIYVSVEKEGSTPITNLAKSSFFLKVDGVDKDFQFTRYYHETYNSFVYRLYLETTQPSSVEVTVIDTRSIKVIATSTVT